MCKVTVLLLAIQVANFCGGLVVLPSRFRSGGEGDPAPGRSPGPPDRSPGPSGRSPGPPESISPREQDVKEANYFDVLERNEASDCDFSGELADDDEQVLNFSISHAIFKTDVLVTGIIYQGKETHFSS